MRSQVTIAGRCATLDWQDLNGDLLKAAEAANFEVFLTVDQGIEYQQNLTGRKIAILILRAKSNRLRDLLQLVPACLAQIHAVRPGHIVKIEGPG